MKTYWVLGHQIRPLPTLGDYSLIEVVSRPGVPGPPPHRHEGGVSEFFYVADGKLDIMVDGAWRTLCQGESLSLEPGQVHTLINNSDRDVRWLTGWSPRGFEKFFEDFGVEGDADEAFENSISDETVQKVVATSADYGMVIEG